MKITITESQLKKLVLKELLDMKAAYKKLAENNARSKTNIETIRNLLKKYDRVSVGDIYKMNDPLYNDYMLNVKYGNNEYIIKSEGPDISYRKGGITHNSFISDPKEFITNFIMVIENDVK